MGADIHIWSETRREGRWQADRADTFTVEKEDDYTHYDMSGTVPRTRDYWYFGLLNEVRTSWPFGFKDRGFPEDASSELCKLNGVWFGDGHSHNWITRGELTAKAEELKLLRAELLITPNQDYTLDHLEHFIRRLESDAAALRAVSPDVPDEDQRLVFWFDN